VSALSFFLEQQGIMTTGISLVRENSESMRPPRALWVSFPLGRPLGKPADAAFQHRVIAAALDLLNRPTGPVLEDFPEDAPSVETADSPACPVSFVNRVETSQTWEDTLARELQTLKPWHDLARRKHHGRTLVGISAQSPEENITALGAVLDRQQLPLTDLVWFKHAIEDLKVLYLEALTAQPGEYSHEAVQRTFWEDTLLGAALKRFYHQFQALEDPRLRIVARMILPREAVGEATGGATQITPTETPP